MDRSPGLDNLLLLFETLAGQSRYRALREDDTTVDAVLAEGASKAEAVANATLQAAMCATGLRQSKPPMTVPAAGGDG